MPADPAPPAPQTRHPLSHELRAAALAVELLEQGQRLALGIEVAARRFGLQGVSRAALQDIAFVTVRRLGLCKALAARLNRKAPPPAMAALQWVALAQLIERDERSQAPKPGDDRPLRHSAVIVDQAVEAALLPEPAAGAVPFLNATLRRFLRERPALMAQAGTDPDALWNFPRWWVDLLRRDHPDQWQQILQHSNVAPGLTLRVNLRRISLGDYRQRLQAAGWASEPVGPAALQLARSTDVTHLPGFAEGLISVQDAGAQLAAYLLDAQAGERILDACAAPGGKAAHLLETVDCRLTALDIDPDRIARVSQNLDRLGLAADIVAGDARYPGKWWDGTLFNKILVDAPCTASGIVRRHPDVRWLRRRSDLATLCARQAEMLAALWPLLKPGGKLLYATCSVFRAEGEERIARFTADRPDVQRLPLAWRWSADGPLETVSQLLPRSRQRGSLMAADGREARDHDGFYYALLQKPP